jgi:aromatic-L-amino-acid decarboxylase
MACESALVALVAARSRYQQLYPGIPTEKLIIYVTSQTHSLGLKAGLALGLLVRTSPVRAQDNYSLRGRDLLEVIEMDKANGKHPIVMSTSGPPVDAYQQLTFCRSWYCRNHLKRRN